MPSPVIKVSISLHCLHLSQTHPVHSSCSNSIQTCSSSWLPARRSCCTSQRRCLRYGGSCRHTGRSSGEGKMLKSNPALLVTTLAQLSPWALQLVLASSAQLLYLSTQGLAVVRGALVGPDTFKIPQFLTDFLFIMATFWHSTVAMALPMPHMPTPLFRRM